MIVDRTHQCDGWRERIAACHDESILPRETDDVVEHVRRCAACHAYADDLVAIRAWIVAQPARSLPPEALDEIWAQTIDRAPGAAAGGGRTRRRSFGFAAAAIITLSVGATLVLGLRPGPGPGHGDGDGGGGASYTDAELDRLDRDLRIAMAHLANAVASAERITVEDVLEGEAATALRRLPLSTTRE